MIMREVREGWRDMHESCERSHRRLTVGKLPFGGCQLMCALATSCSLPPVKAFRFCIQCGGDELQGWQACKTGRTLQCKRCSRTYDDIDKWAFRSQRLGSLRSSRSFELQAHPPTKRPAVRTAYLQKCRFGQRIARHAENALLTADKDLIRSGRSKAAPAAGTRWMLRTNGTSTCPARLLRRTMNASIYVHMAQQARTRPSKERCFEVCSTDLTDHYWH